MSSTSAAALLRPCAAAFLREVQALEAGDGERSWSERRAGERRLLRFMRPPAAVASAREELVPGGEIAVPVRRYEPLQRRTDATIVYVHGGGFCLGDLDQADRPARRVCAAAGCEVVSVGYRLAPEHPFPAAMRDVAAVVEACDAERPLALVGESAGAAIATSVALTAARPLAGLVLVYPCLDAELGAAARSRHATGCWLTVADMAAFWEAYLPQRDRALLELASPAHAPRVDLLPPTCIVTAGADPLRPEALQYAERLRASGVPTRTLEREGVLHGFWELDAAFPEADEVTGEIASWLRERLA